MIYSALYYPASLERGDLFVRDNRFYPGKYSQSFPVWLQYLDKNYPGEQFTFFADTKSPICVKSLLKRYLGDRWSEIEGEKQITIKWLDEHSGKYFWTMQRNLVEGLIHAFLTGNDFLWIDNDAFVNTDVRPLVCGYDAAAPTINHQQMTMDSVMTFVSHYRLKEINDSISGGLPNFLRRTLNDGPDKLRMHTFQEGGLYKLFGYGRTKELKDEISITHLSCYDNFIKWLALNPLDSEEYQNFMGHLEGVDWNKMPGVERKFLDMLYLSGATKHD